MSAADSASFARRIVRWQRRDGRHDLPWQHTRDPYRIWVSEIMLQQTQVAAVVPYFNAFLARFPDVAALAAAEADEVMRLWAGLGYYARARNLHRAARVIVAEHAGQFPARFDDVLALPGIGRSTAAAICAFAYGESRPILDGNVKRVFARCFGMAGDPREKAVEAAMWERAEALTPARDIEAYLQGLMDLGATVCVRSNPVCLLCPLKSDCVARLEGRIDQLPERSRAAAKPKKRTQMLVLLHADAVLIERRPATGIWGGLWSLPEAPPDADALAVARQRYDVQSVRGRRPEPLPVIEHGFTHYHLDIQPVLIRVAKRPARASESDRRWIGRSDIETAALPAPVKRLLAALMAPPRTIRR